MKRIGKALALALALGLGSAPALAFESAAGDATAFGAEKVARNGRSLRGWDSNAETRKSKIVRNGRHMNRESLGDSGAMKLVGIELPNAEAMRRGR